MAGYEPGAIIAFAAAAPLLLLLLYVLRAIPWAKAGPWRLVVLLVGLAVVMFMLAEGSVIADRALAAIDPVHQLPLFGASLAGATAAMVAYLEGERVAARARRLAMTDPLTGLRNRRAFEEALAVAYEQKAPFSVAYVDLDGFKRINDAHGHEAGDEALRLISAALSRAVRGRDTVARLGGDEFALLLREADAASSERVAERAREEVRAVVRARPEWSGLAASFGIAARDAASNTAGLLDRADKAMYAAKRGGGDRIVRGEPSGGT